MPQHTDLKNIFNTETALKAPLFLIYSPAVSVRLRYVCDFIFNRVLHVNFKITTDVNEFENRSTPGINYSEKKIHGAVQIIPQSLLFETGISTLQPEPFIKENRIWFFETESSDKSVFHFDIFCAVFYFISRCEEWQEVEKDQHERFETKASLLFKPKFHLKPVVDHWILELKAHLESVYPNVIFPEKKFRFVSTIDVDNLYAYKSKGFIRTLGAALKDLLKLDLKNLGQRLSVLSGRSSDPFDVYEEVSTFCLEKQIPLVCFFLFRTGTRYDRTVDPGSGAFKKVFEVLKKNKAMIGLHPSYDAAFKEGMLAGELENLSLQANEKINLSRQHFLRFDIKTTPKLLLRCGITTDFSMGFASTPGFRAGTSHPFKYYDFETETETELLFVPFCGMDGAYFVYDTISPDAAFQSLMDLAIEVRKTKGYFISVFHERTFSNHLYPGFGPLYKKLYVKLKEL